MAWCETVVLARRGYESVRPFPPVLFYQKFKQRHSVLWRDLLRGYCEGEQHNRCERLKFYLATGSCAAENITPIGEMPEAFLKIT